ncbi:MAG: hypothetical protein JRC77_00590 [Deltaproteobacteria bacterium]|nr:hypothetical protein [Deltaproteobacteria bacterium]
MTTALQAKKTPGAPSKRESLERVLQDLSCQLTRGSHMAEDVAEEKPLEAAASVLPETSSIHRILQEGLATGRISEIFGKNSSGRTSLALALLAAVIQREQLAVWIDLSDSFDPASARDFGVDLDKLLWVRCSELRTALRCAESVLKAPGFGLVVLDFVALQQHRSGQRIPRSAWFRLRRAAQKARVPLLLLSQEPLSGSCASLALQLTSREVLVSEHPNFIDGLKGELRSLRVPDAPPEQSASLRFSHALATPSSIPSPPLPLPKPARKNL